MLYFFIHLSISGHLGCFHILPVVMLHRPFFFFFNNLCVSSTVHNTWNITSLNTCFINECMNKFSESLEWPSLLKSIKLFYIFSYLTFTATLYFFMKVHNQYCLLIVLSYVSGFVLSTLDALTFHSNPLWQVLLLSSPSPTYRRRD